MPGGSREGRGRRAVSRAAEAAPDAVLVASAVTKVYRTGVVEVRALAGVDLRVERGEMVAVMGPSGSGKTTLLNCLSGLDEIDGGRVLVDDEDVHAMTDARRTVHRARHMGFIFQSFNLIPVFSAEENAELPLLILGERPSVARERARAMLERVGLGRRGRHRPAELSGGEQQRVAIARALVAEPALIWADEPTGNLDSETAAEVMDLLAGLHDAGQSLIIVTHDPGIGGGAPRLVSMRDGQIVADGTPAAGRGALAGRA
ncbi:MAG: ABC transporter ATP-binding protein [Thermoleophilia bacterium]|nr:ABC transporter ATP-binding protein [Thermoleophilia bacterium]